MGFEKRGEKRKRRRRRESKNREEKERKGRKQERERIRIQRKLCATDGCCLSSATMKNCRDRLFQMIPNHMPIFMPLLIHYFYSYI